MFWADELAASATGPQVVNDSKTPSGTVHVGSLRGPVILDGCAGVGQRRCVSHLEVFELEAHSAEHPQGRIVLDEQD